MSISVLNIIFSEATEDSFAFNFFYQDGRGKEVGDGFVTFEPCGETDLVYSVGPDGYQIDDEWDANCDRLVSQAIRAYAADLLNGIHRT